ncbi:classical arabinogalactan protein 9-like [Spinacia oleracea]|uniref:Classical arabinogalactan protein 9-like n=1 Tax=Spinacia oleracea TaxID=3562 RepID=A0ABM3R839_SPIOL|nr:classical arabinogalactan protein 9-like [Spinacia oleracea]
MGIRGKHYHPLHVPFGEPRGPVLQQIREFNPLPNQPRSNPSWLPPPPTQPSPAGTSATAAATTAARVTPSQVGMTTSTMVSVPASVPASRPLPPPMVTMSMPLPVTLPAQGSAPVAEMPWDQFFSQQVVQPVVNVVTSAPGAPPPVDDSSSGQPGATSSITKRPNAT